MHIGLTFDLRDEYRKLGYSEEATAEFDSVETIDAIESAIQKMGNTTERIGSIKRLAELLTQGKRWDMVFNIAEGLGGLAREAQIPGLLEAFEQPYSFSPAEVMVVTLDKSLAKLKVNQAGIATANWQIVAESSDIKKINLPFPLFVKPIAEGTGKGISSKSLVENENELNLEVTELLTRFKQPVLVEKYLSGREFTVGIIGSKENAKVIGVMEIIALSGAEKGGHTFHNKENCETLMEYTVTNDSVSEAAGKLALDAWKALDCLDAGRIDIRCDANQVPHFLEVNPLPGLHPTHSDLPILAGKNGMNYQTLMSEIVNAATTRLKLNNL
jgi:D-alanine-D-alanine ligase